MKRAIKIYPVTHTGDPSAVKWSALKDCELPGNKPNMSCFFAPGNGINSKTTFWPLVHSLKIAHTDFRLVHEQIFNAIICDQLFTTNQGFLACV